MCNRVKEADEERKREIQEVIEIKDERSQMVNTEKDEIRRLVSCMKLIFFQNAVHPAAGEALRIFSGEVTLKNSKP